VGVGTSDQSQVQAPLGGNVSDILTPAGQQAAILSTRHGTTNPWRHSFTLAFAFVVYGIGPSWTSFPLRSGTLFSLAHRAPWRSVARVAKSTRSEAVNTVNVVTTILRA
jgi:hypothetical protein